MTRRNGIIAGVVGVVIVAAATLWTIQRRAAQARRTPEWLDPHQPPEGVAAPLTADQSWAANRARPMTGCCIGRTAGTRIRRTYPATLVDADYSLIRGRASVEVEADGRA